MLIIYLYYYYLYYYANYQTKTHMFIQIDLVSIWMFVEIQRNNVCNLRHK